MKTNTTLADALRFEIGYRRFLLRAWWAKLPERLAWWLAWKLPRRVALFAFVRVYAVLGDRGPDYSRVYLAWEHEGGPAAFMRSCRWCGATNPVVEADLRQPPCRGCGRLPVPSSVDEGHPPEQHRGSEERQPGGDQVEPRGRHADGRQHEADERKDEENQSDHR